MAAALMAVDFFNNRDPFVFQELEHYKDCPITLEAQFFDDRVIGHSAAQSFAQQGVIPCAIAGPFSDQPALELSTFAMAHQFPLVASRAFNNRISSQEVSPFSNQVFPDLETSSEALLSYLMHFNRTNFISFVYPATEVGSQRREAFTYLMDQNKMQWFAQPYQNPPPASYNNNSNGSQQQQQQIYNTMKSMLQRVKDRGYRTIVLSMDDPFFPQFMPLSMAAEELHMTTNDYIFIWIGSFDVFQEEPPPFQASAVHLLRRSVWLVSGENYFVDPLNDPFLLRWRQQPPSFVDRLNNIANPIPDGEPGYVFAGPDYFSKVSPDW